jgi:hypothetical protein
METPARILKHHIVEGDLPQNQLKIEVMDEPGAGGMNHLYKISPVPIIGNPLLGLLAREQDATEESASFVLFQNGPIKEVGINGITQEALLAIVIDRLQSFQNGPFPSEENGLALDHCRLALNLLKLRTMNRLTRGVEGKTEA